MVYCDENYLIYMIDCLYELIIYDVLNLKIIHALIYGDLVKMLF